MHKNCVTTALYGYGRLTVFQVRESVAVLETLLEQGLCPRCGGQLPEWPDTSHAIYDACVEICNTRGNDEALAQFRNHGIVPPLAEWPTLSTAPRRSHAKV
ncbi:hypothetical protein [Allokutzneria oryzae]|uniref:Recombination endonuclease VII n=1 Tax=Allokutzneria oryzae TaxID=1378989 RepID=A0ABV5ZPP3_9PSEU